MNSILWSGLTSKDVQSNHTQLEALLTHHKLDKYREVAMQLTNRGESQAALSESDLTLFYLSRSTSEVHINGKIRKPLQWELLHREKIWQCIRHVDTEKQVLVCAIWNTICESVEKRKVFKGALDGLLQGMPNTVPKEDLLSFVSAPTRFSLNACVGYTEFVNNLYNLPPPDRSCTWNSDRTD